MHVIYKPLEGERQQWEFEPGRVKGSQCAIIQRQYGKTWDVFVHNLQRGDVEARRVLVWWLTKQTHATLKFEDTPDFCGDEFELQYTAAELRARLDDLGDVRPPGVTTEEYEAYLEVMRAQVVEAEARDNAIDGFVLDGEPVADGPGKELSNIL